MKFYFVFTFVFLFAYANAQNFSPALQSMVDTENAFARYSKEKNTRDAFLLYLTDSTVLFDKGGPAWGKKSWEERTPNNSLLFWQPLLVGISKDGDLGFSTGPWKWAPSKEAKPEAYGYFASVWRKFSDGWKLALDIGTPTPGPELSSPTLRSSNPTSSSHKSRKSRESLLDADKGYNDKINKEQVSFIKQSFSTEALILRTGSYPDRYPFKNVPTQPEGLEFIVMGVDVATSNDVGYSFGRIQMKGQKTELNKANFLRVWKIEDGTWKIILDVVAVPDGN